MSYGNYTRPQYNEQKSIERQLATRHGNISGSITLLDISKPRGNVLLDIIETYIATRLADVAINRYAKPAPDTLRQEIKAHNDFVIEALAD